MPDNESGKSEPTAFSIPDWINEIVDGPGGMADYERYELVVWHVPDRQAAIGWVLRCLANPSCEGSEKVLAAIQERRQQAILDKQPPPY